MAAAHEGNAAPGVNGVPCAQSVHSSVLGTVDDTAATILSYSQSVNHGDFSIASKFSSIECIRRELYSIY